MLPNDGFDVFRLAKPPIAGTSWLCSLLEGLLDELSSEAGNRETGDVL